MGDAKSPAAGLLKTHGMTFDEAIKTLQKASAQARTKQYSTSAARTRGLRAPWSRSRARAAHLRPAPAPAPERCKAPASRPCSPGPGRRSTTSLPPRAPVSSSAAPAAHAGPKPEVKPKPSSAQPEPERLPAEPVAVLRPMPRRRSLRSAQTCRPPIARPPQGAPHGGPPGAASASPLGASRPARRALCPPGPPRGIPPEPGCRLPALHSLRATVRRAPCRPLAGRPPRTERADGASPRSAPGQPANGAPARPSAGPLPRPGRPTGPAERATGRGGQRPAAGPLMEAIPRQHARRHRHVAQVRISRDKVESLMQLLAGRPCPAPPREPLSPACCRYGCWRPTAALRSRPEPRDAMDRGEPAGPNAGRPRRLALDRDAPCGAGVAACSSLVAARTVGRDGIAPEPPRPTASSTSLCAPTGCGGSSAGRPSSCCSAGVAWAG